MRKGMRVWGRLRRAGAKGRARRASAVVACALAAALLLPAVVWADKGASGEVDPDNQVNPQQLPDSSFIYDSSIEDLSSADAYFDEQTVQVVGEAVGDNISAGIDGTQRWITLAAEDDANATVSVLMSTESAERIDTFGRYGSTGTKLQVRGTFHLACVEHEGLTDLHAENVSVVEKGSVHPDEFSWRDFAPGIGLVAVGLALMFVFYRLRERQR